MGCMEEIGKLISGYKRFQAGDDSLRKLAEDGQSPRIAIIACSDSRVDPAIVTDARLGDLFVIRNVANLVPPYQPDDQYHGTSAALEFAVQGLNVRHVIVFGHSQCAGIRALVEGQSKRNNSHSFVHSWMQIVSDVRQEVLHSHPQLPLVEQAHLCERKAIEQSLRNLETFPFIQEKMQQDQLSLHGWHFDISDGDLRRFDPVRSEWKTLA